mmetsp:Transcript_99749/g.310704  ORF Transcript_99749/g.310704 Transcript_99749/m.310704 type:complete len:203 (+) Transcript_99749:152-760(+)
MPAPTREAQKAKAATGTREAGSSKCLRTSREASATFLTANSMATVRRSRSSPPVRPDRPYPETAETSSIPMTAACTPASHARTWLALPATVPPSSGAAKSSATGGVHGPAALAAPGAARMQATPRPVGSRTSLVAERRMPLASMGTTAPMKSLAIPGVARAAPRVVLAVITTDSATSPPASSVRRLEPVPPFTHPIMTSPAR